MIHGLNQVLKDDKEENDSDLRKSLRLEALNHKDVKLIYKPKGSAEQ